MSYPYLANYTFRSFSENSSRVIKLDCILYKYLNMSIEALFKVVIIMIKI